MDERRTAIWPLLVGGLLALPPLATYYLSLGLSRGELAWVPRAGGHAETVLFYGGVVDLLEFVLGVAVVLALGYRIARRHGFETAWYGIVRDFALGGALGYGAVTILTFLVFAKFGLVQSFLAFDLPATFGLANWVGRTLALGVQFGLVGLAGAAIAHARGGFGDRPDATSTGRPSTGDGERSWSD